MKLIPLSRGLFAKVDDADFAELSRFKWSAVKTKAGFYAVRTERGFEAIGRKRRCILMHRVLTQPQGRQVVDHQDRDTLNNQRSNLRVCSQSENMLNAPSHRDSVSRFKGVSLHKGTGKWAAQFRHRKLGLYPTEEAAAAAYNRAALEHSAEFARPNCLEEV